MRRTVAGRRSGMPSDIKRALPRKHNLPERLSSLGQAWGTSFRKFDYFFAFLDARLDVKNQLHVVARMPRPFYQSDEIDGPKRQNYRLGERGQLVCDELARSHGQTAARHDGVTCLFFARIVHDRLIRTSQHLFEKRIGT